MQNLILDISMPGGTEWILILLFLGIPLYFLPSIIAGSRHHSNTVSIFLLNLFLGWTFLGWIGSLIWAFSTSSTPTVIVNNAPQSNAQESQAMKAGAGNQIQPDVSEKQSISQQEKIDQLRQYKQLLDEGVITMEEFNKQKAAILG